MKSYIVHAEMVCVQRFFVEAESPDHARQLVLDGRADTPDEPIFEHWRDSFDWEVEQVEAVPPERYNPKTVGHVESAWVPNGARHKTRVWVLPSNLDEGIRQRAAHWLADNGYRYVSIYGTRGWVHRNQPCPECGMRFDADGRCMMGCINH